jgi:hypothetical protein
MDQKIVINGFDYNIWFLLIKVKLIGKKKNE